MECRQASAIWVPGWLGKTGLGIIYLNASLIDSLDMEAIRSSNRIKSASLPVRAAAVEQSIPPGGAKVFGIDSLAHRQPQLYRPSEHMVQVPFGKQHVRHDIVVQKQYEPARRYS